MNQAAWRPLGAVDPRQLVETRDQAHHAIQLPGMVAAAYAPPEEDYSHLNFGWLDAQSAFVSHEVPTTKGLVQFGLRLADLTLIIIQGDLIATDYPLHGKSFAEAKAWLLEQIDMLGLDKAKYPTGAPGDLPTHPVGSGNPFDAKTHARAMAEFCNYYGNANLVLEALRLSYLDIEPGPNAVRMWPHHFDIAVLVTLEEGDPETAKAFGFGFEPGDESCQQPYFYTYPWPRSQRPATLPKLEGLGEWTPPGTWLGTLLKGEDLCQVAADRQRQVVAAYLKDGAEKCRALALAHP
ncbi:MAG: hypothetical protein ACFCBW_22415 [Candidatus Competibacterales bacterium]